MNNDVDWDNWSPTKEAVVCFIEHDGKMLFVEVKNRKGIDRDVAHKEQQVFLEPVGGKPEPGETLLEAMHREIEEEIKTGVRTIKRIGSEYAHFTNGFSITLHIFFAQGLHGEPQETEETKPHLFPITDLPFHKLWKSDECYLPFIFEDNTFHSFSVYNGKTNELLWNRTHGLPSDNFSINDLSAQQRVQIVKRLTQPHPNDYSV